MRDVASAIISHEQTQSNRVLFSNFGCCISKGSPFRLFEQLKWKSLKLRRKQRRLISCIFLYNDIKSKAVPWVTPFQQISSLEIFNLRLERTQMLTIVSLDSLTWWGLGIDPLSYGS